MLRFFFKFKILDKLNTKFSDKKLLIISLVGHYENIAFYLHEKKIRDKIGVTSFNHLRVHPKKIISIIYAIIYLLTYNIAYRNYILATHRSTSKILIFLTKLCFKSHFYTFSDGIGDFIKTFNFETNKKYLGHIGANYLNGKKNAVNVPIKTYIEKWSSNIKFSKDGPVLFIVKYPFEVNFISKNIVSLYSDLINNFAKDKKIYITGRVDLIDLVNHANVVNLGPMFNLRRTITISKVYGLPSTLFFTFASKIGVKNVYLLPLNNFYFDKHAYKTLRLASIKIKEICTKINKK